MPAQPIAQPPARRRLAFEQPAIDQDFRETQRRRKQPDGDLEAAVAETRRCDRPGGRTADDGKRTDDAAQSRQDGRGIVLAATEQQDPGGVFGVVQHIGGPARRFGAGFPGVRVVATADADQFLPHHHRHRSA